MLWNILLEKKMERDKKALFYFDTANCFSMCGDIELYKRFWPPAKAAIIVYCLTALLTFLHQEIYYCRNFDTFTIKVLIVVYICHYYFSS